MINKVKYGICYISAKSGQIAITPRENMAMALTSNFCAEYGICYISLENGLIPTKK